MKHGFDSLDAVLLPDFPALPLGHFLSRRLVMDREEGPDDDIPVRPSHRPLRGGCGEEHLAPGAPGQHVHLQEQSRKKDQQHANHFVARCHPDPGYQFQGLLLPAHGLRTCRKWHLLPHASAQVAANSITAKSYSIAPEGAQTAVILVTFNLVAQK